MAQTRLIIVDDDSIIRMDLRDLLTAMGYTVAGEAADAETAITLARDIRPDLVIMDIRMPGDRDGIDAAATLTAEHIAPVLLLTAFSDPELVRRANEASVVGYLLKPFSEGGLRPAIEVTLARFREFQEMARETHDLREQLETRKLVERAKGVLMAQYNLNEAEAFRRIQKASMDTRRPMKAIAEAILLTSQVSA
ncbi:MAG TPA: response regulator [Chloroflexia bacterium]|jgi:response regulator NasT|nr:response regulator [Chloroflexia bacterium]